MTTIDLNRIRLFVRVVDAGSFTAAAAAAGLPKSSISRAVAALERDRGVRLIPRTTSEAAAGGHGLALLPLFASCGRLAGPRTTRTIRPWQYRCISSIPPRACSRSASPSSVISCSRSSHRC